MKTILIIVILLYAPLTYANEFSILDAQYHIAGYASYPSQQYDITSTNPLSNVMDGVFDPKWNQYDFAESDTDIGMVSVNMLGGNALASESIDFTPNFTGATEGITFSGDGGEDVWLSIPHRSWSLTDLTSGAIYKTAGGDGTTVSFAWGRGCWSEGCSQIQIPSDYFWDSSHRYNLSMTAQNGSNGSSFDGGWITTNLFTVPEPPTALMVLVLLALFPILELLL